MFGGIAHVGKISNKIFTFLVFLIITSISFSGYKTMTRNRSLPISRPDITKKREICVNDLTTDNHPYGKPVTGVLMWENDRVFQEFCARYRSSVRMAAFQTTLPDPLPGEEYNVALAADMLAGTVIESGEIFSVNKTIGPRNRERGFREGPAYYGNQVLNVIGGGVCKIATTLYNIAILANLKIIERWPHSMPVPYVPPGQDATISYGEKDLKFKNITGDPIIIWADTKDNTLFVAIYGGVKPPKITWKHKIFNYQPTYNIYRHNSSLRPEEDKIIIPGIDGYTVKSWIVIENSDGSKVEKQLGIDHYRPLPQLVERKLYN